MEALPCLGKRCSHTLQKLKRGTSMSSHSSKNTTSAEKSKDTKPGNLLHVASAADPKLSKLVGTFHHPRLHLSTASSPEQGLTVPVLPQTNSLSYNPAGIRDMDHSCTQPFCMASYHTLHRQGAQRARGCSYRHSKLTQIRPLQSCRQHQALGFSGEHTPASTASPLPT